MGTELVYRSHHESRDVNGKKVISEKNNSAFVHVVFFAPEQPEISYEKRGSEIEGGLTTDSNKICIGMEVWAEPQYGTVTKSVGGSLLYPAKDGDIEGCNFEEVAIKLLERAHDYVKKSVSILLLNNAMKIASNKPVCLAPHYGLIVPPNFPTDGISQQVSLKSIYEFRYTRIGIFQNLMSISLLIEKQAVTRVYMRLPWFKPKLSSNGNSDDDWLADNQRVNQCLLKDLQDKFVVSEHGQHSEFTQIQLSKIDLEAIQDYLNKPKQVLFSKNRNHSENVKKDFSSVVKWNCYVRIQKFKYYRMVLQNVMRRKLMTKHNQNSLIYLKIFMKFFWT